MHGPVITATFPSKLGNEWGTSIGVGDTDMVSIVGKDVVAWVYLVAHLAVTGSSTFDFGPIMLAQPQQTSFIKTRRFTQKGFKL